MFNFLLLEEPVKRENKIEVFFYCHWCDSIHHKPQSLTQFSSDTHSLLRSLLLVFIAYCLPRSNHEWTYFMLCYMDIILYSASRRRLVRAVAATWRRIWGDGNLRKAISRTKISEITFFRNEFPFSRPKFMMTFS